MRISHWSSDVCSSDLEVSTSLGVSPSIRHPPAPPEWYLSQRSHHHPPRSRRRSPRPNPERTCAPSSRFSAGLGRRFEVVGSAGWLGQLAGVAQVAGVGVRRRRAAISSWAARTTKNSATDTPAIGAPAAVPWGYLSARPTPTATPPRTPHPPQHHHP